MVDEGLMEAAVPSVAKRLSLFVMVLYAAAASSHHSITGYDFTRTLDMDVTVKQVQWTNPHSYIEVLAQNDQGGMDRWTLEIGVPNVLARNGWRKDSLKAGDKVHMIFHPRKDGTRNGALRKVTRQDGTAFTGAFGELSESDQSAGN